MTPEQDPITFADVVPWILSALGAVLVGAWAMLNRRLNSHESSHVELAKQVREIDTQMVTRDTFQRHEADVYGRLDEMRKEAVGREDRIVSAFRDEFRELRARIDKVLDERPQR